VEETGMNQTGQEEAINDCTLSIDCKEPRMASITIRNLDDDLKHRLRVQAAVHGRSMEEEARDILRCALNVELTPPRNLAEEIHLLFAPLGGWELDLPPREPMREPPTFDE
jgi:plasmid stability protein